MSQKAYQHQNLKVRVKTVTGVSRQAGQKPRAGINLIVTRTILTGEKVTAKMQGEIMGHICFLSRLKANQIAVKILIK